MRLSHGFMEENNRLLDANELYDGGTKAIAGSSFKYGTQLFEMNHLVETAKLQKKLQEGTYRPSPGKKRPISERGHRRYITCNKMADKAVADTLCESIIMPSISRFLIYDNTASQPHKGVSLHRRRLLWHLQKYYRKYGSFDGWILLVDFSGYYPNMVHDIDRKLMMELIRKSGYCTESELSLADALIRRTFRTMETDVSRFSDAEIRQMYRSKVDPELNAHVSRKLLTGKKMLRKGVDIGNRVSQCSGIVHPYRIDNYLKIVRGCRYMSRYTDDTRLMHPSKEFLDDCLRQIRKQAAQIGVIVNEKKTRIQPLRKPFRHLQIMYIPKDDGTVVRKINPKSITRERHKLKAYRRLLDDGRMTYPEVENAFKSWLCTNCNVMSWRQIYNLGALYLSLFGRRPTWKRKHSRLTWLMTHRSRAWSSTATATSAAKR